MIFRRNDTESPFWVENRSGKTVEEVARLVGKDHLDHPEQEVIEVKVIRRFRVKAVVQAIEVTEESK